MQSTARTIEVRREVLPGFTPLPYRGIGAPVRNRIEAGLAALREKPADPAIWLGCVGLIVYLSLQAGGYDPIPRNQVGILIWWVLLVGVAVGAFSIKRIGYPARTVVVLFLALVAWTALALGWTQSAERTATELARVVTYLGVFALALAVQAGRRWRALLYGVTTGIAIVAGLAVLSRLHPQWFPPNELGRVLPDIEIERRLAYPLNYSSALRAFPGPHLRRSAARRRGVPGRRTRLLPLLVRHRDRGRGGRPAVLRPDRSGPAAEGGNPRHRGGGHRDSRVRGRPARGARPRAADGRAEVAGERGPCDPDRRLRRCGALPARHLDGGPPWPPSSLAPDPAEDRRRRSGGRNRDRRADRRRRGRPR